MNLAAVLQRQAVERPRQDALCEAERSIDFATLASRVAAGAAWLRARGLRPGDRMLVFHPVDIRLYEVLLAAFHAGVVVVLADPSGGREFLGEVCRRAVPRAFFGSRRAHLLRCTVRGIGVIPLRFHDAGWCPGSTVWESREGGAGMEPEPVTEDAGALITFTSGSTGAPRAAVRSHGFLLAQHRAIEAALELRGGECDLVTLPVFALANLASGVTSVIADADLGHPSRAEPGRMERQLRRWGACRCAASPAFFEALLAGPESAFPPGPVYSGGAPVFLDLLDRMRAVRPGMRAVAVYGSTEAEPIAELDASLLDDAHREHVAAGGGLPAGQPVEGTRVAVLPDRWGEPWAPMSAEEFEGRCLGRGGAGEIVVSGPQVLTGYLDGVGDEVTKVRAGGQVWHRTGDAGYLDEAGWIWLLGRCAARHRHADGRVTYPLSIEAAVRARIPGLRCAALSTGGDLVLVVEADAAGGVETVAREIGCDRVVRIPRLPMDRRHEAKIDYPALRRLMKDA